MATMDGANVAGGRVMYIVLLKGSPLLSEGAGVSGTVVCSIMGAGESPCVGPGVSSLTGVGVNMVMG